MKLTNLRFSLGRQCSKLLWLEERCPEIAQQREMHADATSTAAEVHRLARKYFGACVEVPDWPNENARTRRTKELIANGTPYIANASMATKGLQCRVDVLCVYEDGSVGIVDVKQAVKLHENYIYDLAYRYLVLTRAGYRVTTAAILRMDATYVRSGELEPRKLFAYEDCTERVKGMQEEISGIIRQMRSVCRQLNEPESVWSSVCHAPFDCPFWEYCEPQMASSQPAIEKIPEQINREAIREYLKDLHYPLCFLDFEGYQEAIPAFDGVRPYQAIPFQYSLHVQMTPGGEVTHTEFFGEPGTDPRKALSEQLMRDIPDGACVLAYDMAFEKTVLRGLAEEFAEWKSRLMEICGQLKDLAVPFQKRWYYLRAMQGSCSLKKVLPALYPDNPALNYGNLEGIHNGQEANAAFAELKNRTPEEVEEMRSQLLKYCELDTFALVKILEKLREVAENADK